MEGNIVNKFFGKLKNKFSANGKNSYPQNSEYAFSFEELNTLEEQNKEKIRELKKSSMSKKNKESSIGKKEGFSPIELKGFVDKSEELEEIEVQKETNILDNKEEDNLLEDKGVKNTDSNSFINLDSDRKNIIMDEWASIDMVKLDRYISKGKDILDHNYTITYGDEALKYIYMIREEYSILIEYLIGFNNEKKGIYNKVIFSDKLDNEWRHLASYIKILEKIRSIKK